MEPYRFDKKLHLIEEVHASKCTENVHNYSKFVLSCVHCEQCKGLEVYYNMQVAILVGVYQYRGTAKWTTLASSPGAVGDCVRGFFVHTCSPPSECVHA